LLNALDDAQYFLSAHSFGWCEWDQNPLAEAYVVDLHTNPISSVDMSKLPLQKVVQNLTNILSANVAHMPKLEVEVDSLCKRYQYFSTKSILIS